MTLAPITVYSPRGSSWWDDGAGGQEALKKEPDELRQISVITKSEEIKAQLTPEWLREAAKLTSKTGVIKER